MYSMDVKSATRIITDQLVLELPQRNSLSKKIWKTLDHTSPNENVILTPRDDIDENEN